MNALLHPALPMLLRMQFTGRAHRLLRSSLSRRNWLLTTLGLLLATLWLGNAVASLLFRQPYAPETFYSAVSVGMLGYVLWHVLRVAAKRPEQRIEWTPAERSFLLGGPFTRRELIAYRLVKVLSTTFLKAACVSILFLPELHVWWIGFLGAFLGFSFLEALRLAIEFTASGVSRTTYRFTRIVVLSLAITAGVYALVQTVRAPALEEQGPIAAWSLLRTFGGELLAFRETAIGSAVEAPFLVFANVLTAKDVSAQWLVWLTIAFALLLSAGGLLFRLDAVFETNDSGADVSPSVAPAVPTESGLRQSTRIPQLGGVGPLAWRQFVGAREHSYGVVVALLAPIVLACLPLMTPLDPGTIFANVVGSVGFFSLVLLPSAFKFDFRRDFERLHVLKSLPFHQVSVAVGQIAVPVLLTSAYQAIVLAIAWCTQPIPGSYVFVALACLLPANVIIYGMENVFFLLSPHRLKQEGIEVFFKTTLIFTAKGVLFGIAAAIVFWWVFVASMLGAALAVDHRLLFVVGLSVLSSLAAGLAVFALAFAFGRMEARADCGA